MKIPRTVEIGATSHKDNPSKRACDAGLLFLLTVASWHEFHLVLSLYSSDSSLSLSHSHQVGTYVTKVSKLKACDLREIYCFTSNLNIGSRGNR
jgi:hypothetical protein